MIRLISTVGMIGIATIVLGATAAQAEIPTQAEVDSISAADLTNVQNNQTSSSSSLVAQTAPQAAPEIVAQEIVPGRATRSGPSYIGIGGNFGFGGDTALGDTSFTVYSKIGLTRNFSARPGLVVGGDPTVLLPLTADFPLSPVDESIDFAVAPYVGGSVAISTGNDSVVRPLITGGVDIPVADRVTVTAQGNVAFFSDTEASVIVGVGYNF